MKLRVWGLGFGGFGFRGLGFRFWGLGFRIWGVLKFRVSDLGLRVVVWISLRLR